MNEQELLASYKEKVKHIPLLRYAISYPEEDAVTILTYLMESCAREDSFPLVHRVMAHTQGKISPKLVMYVVNEWLKTTR